jgi:hypothetical protein
MSRDSLCTVLFNQIWLNSSQNAKRSRQICERRIDNQNCMSGNLTTLFLGTDHDGSNTVGECRVFRQFVLVIK